MAFAQQQRKPRYRSHPSDTFSEDDPILSPVQSSSTINHVLSPGPHHSTTPPVTTISAALPVSTASNPSDTETDWHVVSTGLPSSSSTTTSFASTPASRGSPSQLDSDRRNSMEPSLSDPESFSSFRPSDMESSSDTDFAFDILPSHDGTGAFMEDDMDPTSEEDTTTLSYHQQLLAAVDCDPSTSTAQCILTQRNENKTSTGKIAASFGDFEPETPSMPNILLPHGGIRSPSFVNNSTESSTNPVDTPYNSAPDYSVFQPTGVPKFPAVSPDDQPSNTLSQQQQLEDSSSTTTISSADQIKFTRKRRRNLDSIPTHHPSLPGTMTSFAILSALWNNLRRLTNHLIENDTYTADAFTSLVSEATLDGCLPFGSHLHMELAAGLRPAYSNRRYEGLPGM